MQIYPMLPDGVNTLTIQIFIITAVRTLSRGDKIASSIADDMIDITGCISGLKVSSDRGMIYLATPTQLKLCSL
jgi:hypothetical protein